MAHWENSEADHRYNEISDNDELWGPLIVFRPAKNQHFSSSRALALFAAFASVYGMLLNVAIAIAAHHRHLPRPYIVPTTLTLITFAIFQLTLGPAWNRRAFLLARRERYLAQTRETPG
ncbi:MAG: hypothetical protein ABJB12_24520 [Pseudomonadota bacterium]